MNPASASNRRQYIDWARGLAVLIMIEAHTLDAWTRPLARKGVTFRNLQVLGGFAAPLFLWLAGLGVVLAAEATLRRTGSRRIATEALVKRGLEIFVLAFVFRAQSFVVSPGNPLIGLFRVDILNVMGPSMVFAVLAWAAFARPAWGVAALALLATAVAMSTPLVRTAAWVDGLPLFFQWYVRPTGEYTTFTMFPWSGFVLAGAGCGVVLARARSFGRVHMGLGLSGAILVALGFYTASRPSIYPASFFWTTSPTWFAIRLGILHLATAGLYALERFVPFLRRPLAPVERFGRCSLFVYWVHVELVYGYVTWFLRKHLWLWQNVAATVVLTVLMYAAVVLRDRLVERWRARTASGRAPRPIPHVSGN